MVLRYTHLSLSDPKGLAVQVVYLSKDCLLRTIPKSTRFFLLCAFYVYHLTKTLPPRITNHNLFWEKASNVRFTRWQRKEYRAYLYNVQQGPTASICICTHLLILLRRFKIRNSRASYSRIINHNSQSQHV